MIELEEMIYGEPAWAQVIEFFKNGEFSEEHYLIHAIRRWLLTVEEKQEMFQRDIDIADMLNGRCERQHSEFVQSVFNNWNIKLGYKHFGY